MKRAQTSSCLWLKLGGRSTGAAAALSEDVRSAIGDQSSRNSRLIQMSGGFGAALFEGECDFVVAAIA
jgi:hypothetical protein